MNFTTLFEFTGKAFDWFFINVMETLQNAPNLLFMAIGSVTFLIWMAQMAKYNKEAAAKGTLK
jgi:hypothetical protein